MPETIFHKIINREIDADILYEDDTCIAIADIAPVAEHHYLVIPKTDLAMLSDAGAKHQQILGHLLLVANKLAREKGLDKKGFRLVVNNGEGAGQTVFQLHIHLLGGREFLWPPG